MSAQNTSLRRSAAFELLVGRITYVNVQIGYAFGDEAAGSTIWSSLLDGTLLIVAPAAAIPRSPGCANTPALFFTAAT